MQEKRKSQREASASPCIVDLLFSKEQSLHSRVINFSGNGLMIESGRPLPPGTVLTVRFDSAAPEVAVYGRRTCVGMIRWCGRRDGIEGVSYGIGVELARRTV